MWPFFWGVAQMLTRFIQNTTIHRGLDVDHGTAGSGFVKIEVNNAPSEQPTTCGRMQNIARNKMGEEDPTRRGIKKIQKKIKLFGNIKLNFSRFQLHGLIGPQGIHLVEFSCCPNCP